MLAIKLGVLSTSLLFAVSYDVKPDVTAVVQELFDRILAYQNHHESSYNFPFTWQRVPGMYGNDVKLNLHGKEYMALFRDLFRVPDNNMFVPAWITSCLVEAYGLGKAPKPSSQQTLLSLKALAKFYNKNAQYPNSEMTFWAQQYNASVQFYSSYPENLFGMMELPDDMPIKLIEKLLKMMGLDGFEKIMEQLLKERSTLMSSFRIPPDFDDTFVNLGLGGLLTMFRWEFDTEQIQWLRQNTNLTSVFLNLKKFAYRPFSKDQRVNTIDPRSYFYLRRFLDKAHANGEDVSLVSTWDTDLVRTQFDKGVAMPFNVNNVDLTVCANFLFGIVMCVSSGVCPDPHSLIDKDVQQMYLNTTRLIAYEISTNLSSRPDLALTYYPSRFEFYWFVTRSYSWINRFLISGRNLALVGRLRDMLEFTYSELKPALRDSMTNDIIMSTRRDDLGYLYIDNFLGDGDTGCDNQTLVRGDDRIFSTSVSVAALINTWTLWGDNGSLLWEKDTPDYVKGTVTQMVNWLLKHSLSGEFRPWNTFFSGSVKGIKTLPLAYPANRMEYFNGTTFPDNTTLDTLKFIIGMSGYVPTRDYDIMLKKRHFGMTTPMTFDGYNADPSAVFPFWSSEAYTWATELVALAHYDNIQPS